MEGRAGGVGVVGPTMWGVQWVEGGGEWVTREGTHLMFGVAKLVTISACLWWTDQPTNDAMETPTFGEQRIHLKPYLRVKEKHMRFFEIDE